MTEAAQPSATGFIDRIRPDLGGVPETLLWPLRSRAWMSIEDRSFLDDPMAVDMVNRLDYDFSNFGPASHWQPVRSSYSDALLRDYLARYPDAQVLALGEGVETQFWRVDNGRVQWLCVDLPESIALRRQLMPEHPRMTELPLSALDPDLSAHIDPARGLFITASGLLMYFERADVIALLKRLITAAKGTETEMFFDTIPHWLSRKTLRGMEVGNGYVAPPMPFALVRRDLAGFVAEVPGFEILSATNYGDIAPERARLIALIGKIPVLRNMAPLLVHAKLGG